MTFKTSVTNNNCSINDAVNPNVPQFESSGDRGFGMIPFAHRHLVRKHGGLGLLDYWLECWEIDPYGSRYVLMPDVNFKNTTQAKYRRQLNALGLFLFEPRGKNGDRQLWILNLHGSRVKSVKDANTKPRDGVERPHDDFARLGDDIEKLRDDIDKSRDIIARFEPQTQSQSGNQSRSGSYSRSIQDLFNTLSLSEKESFLDFGRKKASQLPKPPELPDKWIAANWEDLYRQFQVSDAGRKAKQDAIAAQYDWENDPRFDKWLVRAFHEGVAWAQENEVEREQRSAFLEWAQATDPYKGRLY